MSALPFRPHGPEPLARPGLILPKRYRYIVPLPDPNTKTVTLTVQLDHGSAAPPGEWIEVPAPGGLTVRFKLEA